MKHLFYFLIIFTGLFTNSTAQSTPFNRGVNLTNWFQASGADAIPFDKYDKSDFRNIQSLGCDVIRLPISLHAMTSGAPDYIPDPDFLSKLDLAISWAEELDLHLILDNHTFDPSTGTDPDIREPLIHVWSHMARHYNGQYDKLYYEILNEPHGIDDEVWGRIQQEVIDTIRAYDQEHTIIVGGANWNSYRNLDQMPVYEDDNLIYTFHFYDPFLFTHQGASWNTPSMTNLRGIPFPYDSTQMPGLPDEFRGTWVESAYDAYPERGTIEYVKNLIDIAVAFRDRRQVPIFCGEFGVYNRFSDPDQRNYWYKVIREYFDKQNISWTAWDYHGGFGLFEKGSKGDFKRDLNARMVKNLGLKIPDNAHYSPETGATGQPNDSGQVNWADTSLVIREILDKYYPDNFYFGCTSKDGYLEKGSPDRTIFLREFSLNVPENEFKQRVIYPSPGGPWNGDDYRGLIKMARNHGQVMRAHYPISPQCSRWAKADNRTPEELENMLEEFMTTISKEIEENSDVIKWMDVVNETVLSHKMGDEKYSYEAGDWFGPLQGDRRWQNPWLAIGQEEKSELRVPLYIIKAFEIANEHAPSVRMLYNQHGGMEAEAWDKVKKTVLYLRDRGLRVDAIGWQAHVPYGFEKQDDNMNKLNELIEWCYEKDLEFHVTEIDVEMGRDMPEGMYEEKAQEIADTYGVIIETVLNHIGKGAISINCWALKHRHQSGAGYFAGLFDEDLNPTPAYFRIKEELVKRF